MTPGSANGRSTRVSRIVKGPRRAVYRAFLDADSLVQWLPPDNMRGELHEFEPRVGGRYRMSLTYEGEHAVPGKTSDKTDTVAARFVGLIPGERIVQAVEFESADTHFAGEMKLVAELRDVPGGTEVTILCENIPEGIRLEDNEMGCRQSLEHLATFVERPQ